MGRHSRPEPPPSRRSPEPPRRGFTPNGHARHGAPDDSHPSGPLPQVSGYHEPVGSFPDDLSELEAPTRRNPSGEDIDRLAGVQDAGDSGYFGGSGYVSDLSGYRDVAGSGYFGDSRDVADVSAFAGSGYFEGTRDGGGVEELEAPTTKTSPEHGLRAPTTTSGDEDLEAPTRKTAFGPKRRRQPEPSVPGDDLEAPTRKHPSRPKRRRARPDESEAPPRRRSAERAARRAAATEAAEAAVPEPDEDAAPDDAKVAALATSSGTTSAKRSRSTSEEPSRSESATSSRSAAQPTETGYHRAVGTSRRGIAKWPIALAAVLALLALGGLGMVWANKALNAQAEAEANSCTEGNRALRVTTTPTIEDAVTTAAKKWNADKPAVYSHCVTVEVTAKAPEKVLPTLREADPATVPAAWITPSAEWAEKLAETNPERVSSTAKPLENARGTFYTYVVVGGEGVDEIQQRAAQQFRDYVREVVAK